MRAKPLRVIRGCVASSRSIIVSWRSEKVAAVTTIDSPSDDDDAPPPLAPPPPSASAPWYTSTTVVASACCITCSHVIPPARLRWFMSR